MRREILVCLRPKRAAHPENFNQCIKGGIGFIIPCINNPNNNAGDEVLEDEADNGVKKSAVLWLPILKNKLVDLFNLFNSNLITVGEGFASQETLLHVQLCQEEQGGGEEGGQEEGHRGQNESLEENVFIYCRGKKQMRYELK